jgi:hypothetical protein
MLTNFKVDPTRSQLVVDVEFYQMNLIRAIEQARKLDPELFIDGDDRLASWSKFAKNPLRAKGFWTHMLQAVFLGQNNIDEMSADFQVGKTEKGQVAMMFLSGNIRRSAKDDQFAEVVAITEQVLGNGWSIIPIYGVETSNKTAEKHTKEAIEVARKSGKNVLILSAGMAQRSYSVGDITRLYLCYDEGDAGATTQKISRALTPNQIGKIGRIFSLSFDPNRDDKFDTMMIATAQNYAKRKGVEIDEALRRVIGTIDIFACSSDGRVQIDPDTYLQQILDRNSLSRMVGKQADMSLLDDEEIAALASGNSDYSRLDVVESAPKGKTTLPNTDMTKSKRASVNKETLKLIDKARKVLSTIVEHLPYLAIMTKSTTVRDSLIRCNEVPDYNEYVTTEFGVTPNKIIDLFDRKILNYDLASLQKTAAVKKLAH